MTEGRPAPGCLVQPASHGNRPDMIEAWAGRVSGMCVIAFAA